MSSHQFMEMKTIETINYTLKPSRITHALFDFDGTLSLIREGWQKVMVKVMVDELLKTPRCEERRIVEQVVQGYVDKLTGKQTMYQMLRFVEEIEKRGGEAENALHYKKRYLQLIQEHIASRLAMLENGTAAPDEYLVSGARSFLTLLNERGIACFIASGTDEPFVKKEAGLLCLTSLFREIWGAKDAYLTFSKKIAIERILKETGTPGNNLVVFGDGYVEIQEAKAHGALAVGVASNEATRAGVNRWKRERLIGAGADIIVGDFTSTDALLSVLFSDS